MYLIAHKLVKHSEKNGYLVGSRGSVGSSLAAALTGITEVNPLAPHYLCPKCKFSDFESEIVLQYSGGSGCDMPDRLCPSCNSPLQKDGHDIAFETFLGFDGEKEPDIDLNFSGEFQAATHAYTEELFGDGYVFKAGTISTYAEKNAFAAAAKYATDKNIPLRGAEKERLKQGLIGVKKTTGQHPGGLMIIPKGHSIYEFTPVQKPANEDSKNVITTHFDFDSIQGALLKLDILGHDAPTILKSLHDNTGVDPRKLDIGAADIVSLFNSTDALVVSDADIGSKTGSLGLPEFGTPFVRQMLVDTKPGSFAELVRISGLSHGTDVWHNNAKDLIESGKASLNTIIPSRDDIFLYLIRKGVEKKTAFGIAENVRRGRGLSESDESILNEKKVPGWYIESCKKIKYLFPKAHAVAYVMMTMRIGFYKIHYPLDYYAAIWSVRSSDFDYQLCCFGLEIVNAEINRIDSFLKDATQTEKSMLSLLENVREFYARGFDFAKLDLYKADAKRFTIHEGKLMPPLCTVAGLGVAAAQSVALARDDGEFFTVEDFKKRTKVNKSVIEILKNAGVLDHLPETDQLTLF
jgi:DNA polymerase-3 subunit alpha (Gram-positive type)